MIHLTGFFTLNKKTPAKTAKKRLKIIISKHQSTIEVTSNYLPQLKEDIINVICKYPQINSKTILLQLSKKDDNTPILELNITLKKTKQKI